MCLSGVAATPPEGARATGASLRSGAARARTSGGDDWEAKAFSQGVLCLEAVQIEPLAPHTGEPLSVLTLEGEDWVARCKHGSASVIALGARRASGCQFSTFQHVVKVGAAVVTRSGRFRRTSLR
jgi:hypothetical protein